MPTKVLFIMLDGCRPDALLQAKAPHLENLWKNGSYTWSARSVMPSVTLPAHSSIFRGVPPQKHGIGSDNTYRSSAAAFPSVIDLISMKNLRCAMFYSWEQLRDLASPGSLKVSYCRYADYGEDNDTPVAKVASEYLVQEQPDFCFLYMGDIDITGHLYNWMSPEYIEAIQTNDSAIGMVLERLEQAGVRQQYTIIVQADHGGHGTDHGTDMPQDMTIPWIINGPKIKVNHALQSPVWLCDTAATIAHLLDVPRPAIWEGKPVLEALAT